jgi:hypothetical protein
VLIEIALAHIEILPLLFDLTLERFTGTAEIVKATACEVELVAHVAEHSLESGDFKRRTSLQFLLLSTEICLLAGKLFACRSQVLLRFTPHARRGLFGGFDESTPMFVGNGAQDVRCRCAQIGFELSAEADADTIERRTDVIVERR